MKESDLYAPLKRFLEGQGYAVKGEVLDCDVLAVRGQETPVVVELKLGLNLTLLMQAVDRLALTDKVYVGVPAYVRILKVNRKRVLRVLRMLGLGLVTIDPGNNAVVVVVEPGPYRGRRPSKTRQERLLGEFVNRVGDPNQGGSDTRQGRVTAYRQRAIRIARWLEGQGPTKAAHIADATQDTKARDVLYRNVYGWFERESVGVYGLSPRGLRELPEWTDDTSS